MDNAEENQAFRIGLLTAVQSLRNQSAQKWEHEPVLAKTLERVRDYLEVLLSSCKELTEENESVARKIWLDSLRMLGNPGIETVFDIEADLRAGLAELAGDDYTYMCLQHEKQRLQQRRKSKDPDHLWTAHFPESELNDLLTEFDRAKRVFKTSEARKAAIGRLVELYKQSRHELRRNRAHAAEAGRYLSWLSLPLLILLGVVAVLLGVAEAFDWTTLSTGRWAELIAFCVAILGGAIGGVLGLMFRFRDAHGRIRDLLRDRDVCWVQPSIGAAMGLTVVLILRSGLIKIGGLEIGGTDLVRLAALGFVAGFCEPVFFGVIDRVARMTSPKPSDGDETSKTGDPSLTT